MRLTLILAVAATAVALATTNTAVSSGSCPINGTHQTINGADVVVYCGPAHAKATIQGKTLYFSGGLCSRPLANYLRLSIGTRQESGKIRFWKYFDVGVVNAKRGPNKGSSASVHFVTSKASYLVMGPTVVLNKQRDGGTFKGTATMSTSLPGSSIDVKVSGKFNCKGGV